MENACLIYITCKDTLQAKAIAQAMVGQKLAACANMIEGMTSLYEWKGELVEDTEVLLLLKTVESRIPQITVAVKGLHSYEIPCIVSVPISGGNQDYIDWIHQNCLK